MVQTTQAPKTRTIKIKVNNNPVVLTEERGRPEATGAEIKAAAIAQGLNIQADFALFLERGNELDQVGDDEVVRVRPGQKFRAVGPDDNS
jgi:hypothetical protein